MSIIRAPYSFHLIFIAMSSKQWRVSLFWSALFFVYNSASFIFFISLSDWVRVLVRFQWESPPERGPYVFIVVYAYAHQPMQYPAPRSGNTCATNKIIKLVLCRASVIKLGKSNSAYTIHISMDETMGYSRSISQCFTAKVRGVNVTFVTQRSS